jgi:Concanavalin A-like lectin/glucanases superfamily
VAIEFSAGAVTGRIQWADAALWDTTLLTISFWARPESGAGGIRVFCQRDNNTTQRHFQFRQNGGNADFILFPGPTTVTSSGVTINDGAWRHFLAYYDATDMKIFIDGTQRATGAKASMSSVDYQLDIGSRSIGTTSNFDGDMCEFGYWDAALNADERQALADGYPPSLIRTQSLRFYSRMIAHAERLVAIYGEGTTAAATGSGLADAPHARVRETSGLRLAHKSAPPVFLGHITRFVG